VNSLYSLLSNNADVKTIKRQHNTINKIQNNDTNDHSIMLVAFKEKATLFLFIENCFAKIWFGILYNKWRYFYKLDIRM